MERRERLRNIQKCTACKTIVFHCRICKFVTFLLSSSSACLLELPIIKQRQVLNFSSLRFAVCSYRRVVEVSTCMGITQLVYWIAHWFHRNARMVRRSPHSSAKYSRQSFPFLCHAQGRKIRTSTPAREKCGSFCSNWGSSRRKRCLQLPFNRGRSLCFCFAGAILSQLLLKEISNFRLKSLSVTLPK